MHQGIYGFVNKFVDLHMNACVYKWIHRLTDEPTDLTGRCIDEFIDLSRNNWLCKWIKRFVSDPKDIQMH